MGPYIRIYLFGDFRVLVDDRLLTDSAWRSRKAATLVKLLALAPNYTLHRDQILDTIWPELDPDAAANNLHYTLHTARRLLGTPSDECLVLRDELVRLGTKDDVWIDVVAFEEAASRARLTDDIAAHRTAVALYTGDLLPGDLYQDWASSRRDDLRNQQLSLLLRLARLAESAGERGEAIEVLHRALAGDPLLEEAHVELMGVLARSGQRQQALRQYDQLRQILKRELDAEPDESSRSAYEDILAGRVRIRDEAPATAVSLDTARHNVPTSLTTFIGRRTAINSVRETLASGRLMTLTGAGGTGKTRLALEVARGEVSEHPDGVWFIELASIASGVEAIQTLAVTLSIEERTDHALIDLVCDWLSRKRLLLVLDNCEHIIDAAAGITHAILARCPHVRILTTSREPLGVPGETVWLVPPLALPVGEGDRSAAALGGVEAVQLFVERARARLPEFRLSDDNAPCIDEICRRLGGLPLAIELAAARVGVLSLQDMAARLENALGLLTSGTRTAEPRQKTLRGALDWSYNLLDGHEQSLFRRLAVFSGGWNLEAAEAICEGQDFAASDVLDLLSQLVDKSLVVATPGVTGSLRYSMLEPVRQYAGEHFAQDPAARAIEQQHTRFFTELTEKAHAELFGPNQGSWFDRLEEEHDNLRSALRRSIGEGDAETGLRLIGTLWRFWATRGYASEGRKFQSDVLGLPAIPSVDLEIQAQAINGVGALAYFQGDYVTAKLHYERALSLRREIGNPVGIARVVSNLALVAKEQGDYERALALHEEALELGRSCGDTRSQAASLNNLGILLQDLGEFERSAAIHRQSLALMKEAGALHGIVHSLNNLSAIALELADYDQAAEYGEQALRRAHEIGSKRSISVALINLGRAARERGEIGACKQRLTEAIKVVESTGDTHQATWCLDECAALAHSEGRYGEAATLLGATAGLRQQSGSRLMPVENARFEAKLQAARDVLPAVDFDAAFEKGKGMNLRESLLFAVSFRGATPEAATSPLTRREQEIAGLVADGLTNKQIAVELEIAKRTVDTHVESVLRKLGVDSRTAVATVLTGSREG